MTIYYRLTIIQHVFENYKQINNKYIRLKSLNIQDPRLMDQWITFERSSATNWKHALENKKKYVLENAGRLILM